MPATHTLWLPEAWAEKEMGYGWREGGKDRGRGKKRDLESKPKASKISMQENREKQWLLWKMNRKRTDDRMRHEEWEVKLKNRRGGWDRKVGRVTLSSVFAWHQGQQKEERGEGRKQSGWDGKEKSGVKKFKRRNEEEARLQKGREGKKTKGRAECASIKQGDSPKH